MPQTILYDRTGANVGSVDLAEVLFAAPVNEAVLHQAGVALLAGRLLGTSSTKWSRRQWLCRQCVRHPHRTNGY